MIAPFYFAPFEGKILITNDSGCYAFLSEEDFQMFVKEDERLDPQIFEDLEEDGFCYSDSIESYIRRNKDAIRDSNGYLFNGTSLIILAITNACNNNCMYCQANGTREVKNMSIEVAEQALQKIKNLPSAEITIEFQGGEPLLNFPVIQYVVERGKVLLHNKTVRYTVVSNLGLLNDEIANFLKEHEVSISTSLDGPANIHDVNRPLANGKGSYGNTIHGIKLLREYGINPGAIQTTTCKSLQYAVSIVDEYVKQGFHQIFLRPLTRLGAAARCWDQVGYDAKSFLSFYRSALNRILEFNIK